MSTSSSLPRTLPPDLLHKLHNSQKLSLSQAGHLRHFHNLATAPPGEWHHMGTQVPGQEWLDSLRYQLATMAYAAGVAHYHRLPALRSVFKSLLEALIAKMMNREVWGYWYLTSQSGLFSDPDIKELRKPWPNPVQRENIMYSGHLLLMVSLHAMLFDDDKYDAPDALVFDWNPIFWGMGPERFSYTRNTLQEAILKEMENENWIGVCCEPNCVFVVCNQFPLVAIRYNDIRNGTNIIDGVLQRYTAAWKARKGFLQDDGLFIQQFKVKRGERVLERGVSFTAWACAFMNAWNSEEVHALYPTQALGFLSATEDGRVNLNSTAVGQAIRTLVKEEGADPAAPATLRKARAMTGPPKNSAYSRPDFGYVAQWVSEVGDTATLEGILHHADTFFDPTWERGGLFYPHHNEPEDADGNWTRVDAYTGNAAIGYARLNVRDGQKKMWEAPWPRYASSPYIEGVDLSDGVDFLRGEWDADAGAMIVTMRTWDGSTKTIYPVFRGLPPGKYGVYTNGELTGESDAVAIMVPVVVGGQEVDLVLLRETGGGSQA